MKTQKLFSILTTVIFPLFFADLLVADDITGNTTYITETVPRGAVTGNKGGTNTITLVQPGTQIIIDPKVPTADSTDNVISNHVIIYDNGVVSVNTLGGVSYGSGNVSDNTVTVHPLGKVSSTVYGGFSFGNGNVTGNIVTMDGEVTQIAGGRSEGSGTVSGNSVQIKGKASESVYGGFSNGSGNVTGNIVTITDNASALQAVGGQITNVNSAGTVNNNTVNISGIVSDSIYGGFTAGLGSVYDNTVTISGKVTRVAGGSISNANSNATVSGNNVTVSNTATEVISGHSAGTGSIINNTVTITGTAGVVTGGQIDNTKNTGIISGNVITISGTATQAIGGTGNGSGDVSNNIVTVSGTVDSVFGGFANAISIVTGNSVSVSGTINISVFGGSTTGSGNVTANRVDVSGKVNQAVYGGRINNSSNTGIVSGNTVTVSGTAGAVYGGYSRGTGSVADNTVTVNGTVTNEVHGGYTSGTGMVSNNTVNITSTARLANASLYGRNNAANGTGNTLNVNGFSGSVATMANFDSYNFVLGRLGGGNGLTFIEITGSAVNIDGTKINISFAPEFMGNVLSSGDVITVISSINANANPASVAIVQSPFVVYNYIETHDMNALLLKLKEVSLQPPTAAVGEGFVAGLAFLGQAADLRSHIYFVPQGRRFIPFAKMVYGKQNISIGSSVKVKGFSAIAGLALNTNFDNGAQLVVGAFVEGGWGDYNSRHSFSNSSTVKGKGDTEYYGGGVLARYVLKNGLYGEGTFAAGKTETDFRSRDFAPGTTAKYDYSVPYYSTHVAVGQVLNLTGMLKLDIYGKYLWARQGGANVAMEGYRFKFKDADSHRLQAGGKLQADVSPQLQPYVGAAYEYEFSGKIKGSLYGMHLDKPSLRGGAGIGELGLVWSPTGSGNFKVDLGAQGYAGKREGVSGGLTVTMSF